MHKILIVEDEEAIRLGLVDLLEIEGYQIDVAVDGEEAIEKVRQFQPHLVILDLMLPKLSGYDVCRYIRKTFPQTFIMMLTAKNEEINKIQGLEIGADDYVTKPFSVFELMARLKSMLRRVSQDAAPTAAAMPQDILEFDDIRVDFRKYEASKGGTPHRIVRQGIPNPEVSLHAARGSRYPRGSVAGDLGLFHREHAHYADGGQPNREAPPENRNRHGESVGDQERAGSRVQVRSAGSP